MKYFKKDNKNYSFSSYGFYPKFDTKLITRLWEGKVGTCLSFTEDGYDHDYDEPGRADFWYGKAIYEYDGKLYTINWEQSNYDTNLSSVKIERYINNKTLKNWKDKIKSPNLFVTTSSTALIEQVAKDNDKFPSDITEVKNGLKISYDDCVYSVNNNLTIRKVIKND